MTAYERGYLLQPDEQTDMWSVFHGWSRSGASTITLSYKQFEDAVQTMEDRGLARYFLPPEVAVGVALVKSLGEDGNIYYDMEDWKSKEPIEFILYFGANDSLSIEPEHNKILKTETQDYLIDIDMFDVVVGEPENPVQYSFAECPDMYYHVFPEARKKAWDEAMAKRKWPTKKNPVVVTGMDVVDETVNFEFGLRTARVKSENGVLSDATPEE